MTTTISTARDLAALVSQTPSDNLLRLAYADALEESGRADAAAIQRQAANQTTPEGTEIVTVGRYGAHTTKTGPHHSVGVYTTKVYRATRRADGLLTWRLAESVPAHRTAGRKVTRPMRTRASEFARQNGLPVAEKITHGVVCP